jgi:4a-hydroxytetrahydrobiopterin dehydratase
MKTSFATQSSRALQRLSQDHSPSCWTWRDAGAFSSSWIERRFEFEDFAQAFTFMTAMAFYSERQDHHPDWTNLYNAVMVRLSTHDVAGVSERDLAWAEQADRQYAAMSLRTTR